MNLKSIALKPIVGAAAVAALAATIAQPAQAISVSVSPNLNQFSTDVSGATTVTFTGVPTPSESPVNYTSGLATYTGTGRFVAGSVSGRYAEPPNNQPAYLTLGAGEEPGPVTITFAKALNYFGLYWGSIDTYNSIKFFTNNGVVTLAGDTIRNPANGDQQLTGARFVNFFAGAGETFDKIELISSQAAFESDNHAYRAVPTPALVPAAIGFGAAMLRKRKGEQDENETAEAKA